jgi:DNA-binding SARP family transcriptional activator
MRFCVLGPLEAYENERALLVGGGRQRALLALLLMHAGEIVSRDRLIDELWHGEPPASASQSLDSYLSRLRKVFRDAGADDVLATKHPGYLLRAPEIDALQFEALVREGQEALTTGDPATAAARLSEALSLWRGQALPRSPMRTGLGRRGVASPSCGSPLPRTESTLSWRSGALAR